MGYTTGKTIAAALAGVAMAASGAAYADGHSGGEAAVKYRQAVMKAVGGHAGALGALAKGAVPHKDHLAGHARALNDLSTYVIAAFEAKSMEGETRSKENIWTDRAGFEQVANDLVAATGDLASAAEAGNMDAFGAALKATFDSCKACHQDYRAKK